MKDIEKKNKRILFVYGKLVGGGAEKVLIDILRNIDYNRYEVDLALVERGGVLENDVPKEVNIIELWEKNSPHYFLGVKFSLHLHWNGLMKQRMNSKRLRKAYDAEIAFLEGLPSKLVAMRKSPSPKISWIHVDLFSEHRSKNFFYSNREEERAYSGMDKIICVSNNCREGFLRVFPSLVGKTTMIYNPIDTHNILAKAKEPITETDGIFTKNRTNVIIVGRLSGEKNPYRVIEAATLAKEKELPIKFHWLGEGELLEGLLKEREMRKLEENIEFHGFKKNPYPYIANADILLLPSDAEGFGLVLCEAMTLGIPVVSTPTAGPKEIIGENEYGLLADFSASDIIEKIQKLVEDENLRKRLIEAGKKRAEDFSVASALKNLDLLVSL